MWTPTFLLNVFTAISHSGSGLDAPPFLGKQRKRRVGKPVLHVIGAVTFDKLRDPIRNLQKGCPDSRDRKSLAAQDGSPND
jgi:hypothetical protein